MLPTKSVTFFRKAPFVRRKKGWVTKFDKESGLAPSPSLIKAIQRFMFQHSGRLTIRDMATLFPRKGVTYRDCLKESPGDLLSVIRIAWMGGYLHYTKMRASKVVPLRNRDDKSIEADIAAMRKLQKRFPISKHPGIWASLEEGCGQFHELLSIPIDMW